jgi:uncharacterized delta-60 repeat protein
MYTQIKNPFKIFLVFAFLLTGVFSIPTFAQDEILQKRDLPFRSNPKTAPDELLEESVLTRQFFPSKTVLNADSEAFLKASGAANAMAAGDLDPTFAPNITNYPGSIRITAFQADGKMLVGGFFKRINGEEHFGLMRFNANGTPDSAFAPKIGETVTTIAVQPDGKILIGGGFTRVNGVGRNRIARLNADGSLDTTFNPGGGADNTVYSISLQPDGKIIVGGFFRNFDTNQRSNLARLNSDGTIDFSFDASMSNEGFVITTYLLPDGKILAGGFYTVLGGPFTSTIQRFNPNGSLDSSFNPGDGANSTVRDIKVQPDGKILIGGSFTSYNGTPRGRIARLNADGTLDTSFTHTSGANNAIYSVTLLNSGKIVIGGFFTTYEGTSRNFIAQLNSNGSLDTSFNPGTGFNGGIYETVALPANQIFAGGNVTFYNGFQRDLAARINADGSIDSNFGLSTMAQATLRTTLIQPDGKVVVGGSFNISNNVNHNSLVRLNTNGTNDTTFNAGTGTNANIYTMALQPDGKILIGGSFTSYNGTTRNRIARVNTDGTLDTSFAANADSSVANITIQQDGKILVGGSFITMNGVSRTGLARLNADGTLDNSFVFNSPVSYIEGIGVQADGKIVVGGIFDYVDSTLRFSVARLNSNGSLDTSFSAPLLPGGAVYSLAIQPDGKILIGGTFIAFTDSSYQYGIARLKPNGSLDDTFLVGAGTSEGDDVEDIVVQPNGKILLGGSINSINGIARNNIARLNANGTLDLSFNPNVDNDVWDINLEPTGARRILIGGDFNAVNGIERTGLARLIPDLPFNRTPFDFDGDTKTDISIYRPSVGEWWINRSASGQTVAAQFGTSADKAVPADFTGDGKADIAFFRPATGEWFILRSEDASYLSFPFGASGDIPLVGDFDGDGKTDPTVFRPSTNEWFISKSTGGTLIVTFGAAGDAPVPADYDSDGKTDIAIYRPSVGQWWIQRSSNLSVYAFTFGTSTDKPVQGDYTGDGKADSAFFRPSTGEWFILRSEDSSFYSVPFGVSGDLPVPGDYDGDGRFDTAVFRPSNSNWYINRTTSGLLITTFGANGDKPIPNVFVP